MALAQIGQVEYATRRSLFDVVVTPPGQLSAMPRRGWIARARHPTLAARVGCTRGGETSMGVIFFGTRPYGRVDAVPGAYISTTFGYLQFLPLLPTRSYVFVIPAGAGEPI